jgi:hypothetical protein
MKRPLLLGFLMLLLGSSLSAQVRLDFGVAAGRQSYEGIGLQSVIGPEVMLTRGRLGLYYALDRVGLPSVGPLFASHLGLSYRWPVGRNLAIRAGAGPSYVTLAKLGGTPTWHAEAELALRTGRLEWFAKTRYYDYTRSNRSYGESSADGPALLGGVRVTLNE